ncbi:MAG: hypothetical protein KAH84_11645 [Thiomargarita sp.]|nr:hypothetical protein [Thiomargarita sp.]
MEQEQNALAELVHYYEVRILALTEYSGLIWNRFNWFLTLQLVIFGFLFTRLETLPANYASIVPIMGIVITLLWSLIGYEDYNSMKRHGKVATDIDEKIKKLFAEQGIDFDIELKKSATRFRQTWILFVFPIIVSLSWIFFII